MLEWDQITERFGPMAVHTAWRILGSAEDTEDVVQEAMLEVFRQSRHSSPRDLGAFIRTVVSRRAIDLLRKRSRSQVSFCDPHILANTSCCSDETVPDKELANAMRLAISRLSDHEATVFTLRYFETLTNQQIANVLAISPSAVSSCLSSARKKLRSDLRSFLSETSTPKDKI